ncbi:hypothetical protein J1792_32225 [Streptomyces triculaminicus]|uniref:Uncharacterized protein n=1 Tax=Streptomyces triculaminicus TaxID=2816232 RepID=A0A939FSC1_9ACTN|nr:hypothetical protein [Streptomyces triculaminicus]MBO0657215.1 hypothetical protein [Streptomyces triculaminicus]
MSATEAEFARVLAAVIPLVLLAAVVEGRGPGQARQSLDARGWRIVWPFLSSVLVLTFLAFLEVAVLLAAADQVGPCVSWLAGPPGAIGVGIIIVLTARLAAENLAADKSNSLDAFSTAQFHEMGAVLLTLSITAGVSCIIGYWPPSTVQCKSPWLDQECLVLYAALLVGWRIFQHIRYWPRRMDKPPVNPGDHGG